MTTDINIDELWLAQKPQILAALRRVIPPPAPGKLRKSYRGLRPNDRIQAKDGTVWIVDSVDSKGATLVLPEVAATCRVAADWAERYTKLPRRQTQKKKEKSDG